MTLIGSMVRTILVSSGNLHCPFIFGYLVSLRISIIVCIDFVFSNHHGLFVTHNGVAEPFRMFAIDAYQ